MTLVFLFVLAVSTPLASHPQGNGISPTGTGGSHVIQGQVYLPSGKRAENVHVTLQSFGAGELSVMSSGNGEFTFRALAPGQYKVILDAGKEYEAAEENVFIDTDVDLSRAGISTLGSRRTVILHLRTKPKPENYGKPATISAAALAEVPEAARKLYQKALDLAEAADSRKAVENLKSAISVFPNFIAALDEIGVQYLKLGQADKAVEPLTNAVKLSPDAFRPNLDLWIALLENKRFDAAESRLKTAIKLNDASPTAHMYLGIALISGGKLAEAQTELETAVSSNAPEVAKVHYCLGGVYWGNRDYSRAANELDTYLKLVPKAPEAEKVRQTIKELRQQH